MLGYLVLTLLLVWASLFSPWVRVGALLWGAVLVVAVRDYFQIQDNVRRNYPFVGSLKQLIQKQRHIPQEVLLQSSWEGRPFSLLQQRIVHKRAEDALTNEPFGTELDYRAIGHDWLLHSLYPSSDLDDDLRVVVGGPYCQRPYSCSILNVSAMSFGSISSHAVQALCEGALIGNFAVNTGEGGVTKHHLESGCDLIWQIGTGYFGCRDSDGQFSEESFEKKANSTLIKMIEIKVSQGAKPGFGAILPASKNTEEIAKYRDIEPHTDVHSPPHHSAFRNHEEMLKFISNLREKTDGKPIGIKLCLGCKDEFVKLCRLIQQEQSGPDFITIAGGEGGSGAAALDSVHHVGAPAEESLVFVHDRLVEFGLREEIKIFVAGKVISGFDIFRYLALGADVCYSARGMMFALGCVQSLKCNTNCCPTGITTMNKSRVSGLVVSAKKQKVANYHANTIEGVGSLLKAAGMSDRSSLSRSLIERRTQTGEVRSLEQIYPSVTK